MFINGSDPPATEMGERPPTISNEQTRPPEETTSLPSPAFMKSEIVRLQAATIAALKESEFLKAEGLLKESEALIDDALNRWPEDTEFLNLRAYHYKNMALEYRQLEMDTEMQTCLSEAEKTFKLLLSVDTEDPVAWNGLGSVYLLRCEIDLAVEAIDRALTLNPDYDAAARDKDQIPAFRTWCSR